jgi:H+/gluconate symporter-like permease
VVRQVKKAEREKEGFEPSGTALLQSWDSSRDVAQRDMPLWKCLLPSIVLFIVLNLLKASAVTALVCGTFTSYLVFGIGTQFKTVKSAALTAVQNANQALVALASAAGFGGVVASVTGFKYILGALDQIPGPPVFQIIIAVNVAAGFSASSSTGQILALDMLADRFLSFGLPPEALHRLCSISSIGLDTLPHSSALANTFYMCKLSYKDAYINNFMISVVFTLLTAVFAGFLINWGLTF